MTDFPFPNGMSVHVSSKEWSEYYRQVVFSSGSETVAMHPKIDDVHKFEGQFLHGQAYKSPADFKDKNIIVLGMGNSACDTACELTEYAAKVYLAHRRGAKILPRANEDGPLDSYVSWKISRMALWTEHHAPGIFQILADGLLQKNSDSHFNGEEAEQYVEWGLEETSGDVTTIICNDHLKRLVHEKRIASVKGVKRVVGPRTVELDNGDIIEDVDAIIACTGYRADFSLLPDLPSTQLDASLPAFPDLYQMIFPPRYADSLACTNYCIINESAAAYRELQAMAIAQVWAGNSVLPSQEAMTVQVNEYQTWLARQMLTFPATMLGKGQMYPWMRWLHDTAGRQKPFFRRSLATPLTRDLIPRFRTYHSFPRYHVFVNSSNSRALNNGSLPISKDDTVGSRPSSAQPTVRHYRSMLYVDAPSIDAPGDAIPDEFFQDLFDAVIKPPKPEQEQLIKAKAMANRDLGHQRLPSSNASPAASPPPQRAAAVPAPLAAAPSAAPSASPAAQSSSDLRNIVRRKLTGYVGFANLPNQWHRKSVRKGFNFNVMVVGESGLGKSTLVNTLFNTSLYPPKERKGPSLDIVPKTVSIQSISADIEEAGVRLRLTVVDTPGFGDFVNNDESWRPIVDNIEQRYDAYLDAENKVNRMNIVDNRIHACVFFIQPTGHSLKPLDIEVMRRLHTKVNLIPVIAKSDTLTDEEIVSFKARILADIKYHGIQIFEGPRYELDDEETIAENNEIMSKVPFAVVGAGNEITTADGRKVRGRAYPWGIIEVDNEEHCDFVKLRQMLIRTHMEELKEHTNNTLYENYRTDKLIAMGVSQDPSVFKEVNPAVKQEEERALHEQKLAKMEAEMKMVFQQKVTEKESKLKQSEEELYARHREMKEQLERQRMDLEEKKQRIESGRPIEGKETKKRGGFSLR
ncbi:hypothetical protein VDGE_00736 [Verticillium dahliae]|uniref:Septin-type G domain-containing protein n=2 Tax=Verticillium TaxID=1036719 RepID=A0A444RNI0_VERDA|nr:hypothetical protein VDGE_00736 [Verticillium dahliae]